MALPVNVDSTYADSGTDASVALHQQHHDTIHAAVNGLGYGLAIRNRGAGAFDLNYALPGWQVFGSSPALFSATGTSTAVTTEIYFTPIYIAVTSVFDGVGTTVTTAAASSLARIGLYSADSSTRAPSALLYDWGTVSGATTGDKRITISVTLQPGVYWLAQALDSTTLTCACLNPSAAVAPFTSVHYAPSGATGQYWAPVKSSAGTPVASGLPSSAGTTAYSLTSTSKMWTWMRYDRTA